MKTIVIIENEAVELEALVGLFRQWQQEINILTASEEHAAINIMSKQQVDLIVCDLAIPGNTGMEGFSMLTHSFPHIPCIALADRREFKKKEAIERGASHYLEKPVDSEKLLLHARELLDIGTSGTVKGIPIHSFLQMLESEEKTCTLQVNRKNDRGMLYINKGTLIDAETKSLIGEEAAYLILTWEETIIEIKYFNCQRKQQIHKPLIAIIIEAFRLRSERDKLRKKEAPATLHQLPLKHLSTRENRISLDIGTEIKIEFPHMKTPLKSTIIGMLKDQFLIITTPSSFSIMEKMISSEQRIIIEYAQDGRIWMFKSQLLKTINSPSRLLFIEYPAVIHFHDLRKSKRTAIFVPCTFHQSTDSELYGTLIDLSTSGGLCRIKNKPDTSLPNIDVNNRIQLRCLLPGTKEEQKIEGIVRNLKKDNIATRIGIEFENLQPHLIETISKYLYSVEG